MSENTFETQYDVTKKSRLKRFYEKNKILIFSILIFLILGFVFIAFYFSEKDKKNVSISNNYIEANILLDNKEREKAKNILKKIVLSDNSTYSALSFFLILNENLITDQKEISNLFDKVLSNNKSDKEMKNLMIFKKALFQSNYLNETELLTVTKPLINSDSIWKPHALQLLGDYFFTKKEYSKAKEFYTQILSLQNIDEKFHKHSKLQLAAFIDK